MQYHHSSHFRLVDLVVMIR